MDQHDEDVGLAPSPPLDLPKVWDGESHARKCPTMLSMWIQGGIVTYHGIDR